MWHIHTITQSAIEFLTSCFTSFHFLTPISGVLNLVYITTSSTNVRLLSPHGPPSFAENSTLNFREDEQPLGRCRKPFQGTTANLLAIYLQSREKSSYKGLSVDSIAAMKVKI